MPVATDVLLVIPVETVVGAHQTVPVGMLAGAEMGEQGGLVKAESALYASKVQLVCPKCGAATRVGHTKVENKNGKTVSMRVCKKCGAQFE